MLARRLLAAVALLALTSACVPLPGFGFDQPEAESLAPYPLEITLAAGFTARTSAGRVVVTDAEDPRVLTVSAARTGGAASARSLDEVLPGVSYTVNWSRPYTFDGMSGIEARVTETAPVAGQEHWIGILDAPSGVLFLEVSGGVLTDPERDSIRRVP